MTTLTAARRKAIAAHLTKIAASLPNEAVSDELVMIALELDPKQASQEQVQSGKTVSLEYAYRKLAGETSFMGGWRITLHKLTTPEGESISCISDDLRRVKTRSGKMVDGLNPKTRLGRGK